MVDISKHRVLVVDDQAMIRDAIRRVFRVKGAEFDIAADGRQAVHFLTGQNRYSAAIIDQKMPELSGLEILKLIRSAKTTAAWNMPVLLVTGHSEPEIVKKAVALDADAILTKPFSNRMLLERLAAAIETPRARRTPESYQACAIPRPPRSRAASGAAAPAVVLPDKPLWYTANNLSDEASANTQAARGVDVDSLEPGMVLGQSIHAASGALLAGPRLVLNRRVIQKIQRLADRNPDYRVIRILDPDA